MQDQFKPSIRLEEDGLAPTPGIPPGDGSPVPTPGTPPGKGGVAPASGADPRTSGGPTGQGQEPKAEIATIIGPSDLDADWQRPVSEYLRLRTIPDDETKTRCLAHWVKGYVIHNGELCHRNTLSILQRCVPTDGGKALLNIHEGIYGHHASSRSIVRSYRGCQYFMRQIHASAQDLETIPITWAFTVWGLDLLGPFKKVHEGLTHLFISINKFTKWIEARPLAKAGSK
jgi:hypothetical protein